MCVYCSYLKHDAAVTGCSVFFATCTAVLLFHPVRYTIIVLHVTNITVGAVFKHTCTCTIMTSADAVHGRLLLLINGIGFVFQLAGYLPMFEKYLLGFLQLMTSKSIC